MLLNRVWRTDCGEMTVGCDETPVWQSDWQPLRLLWIKNFFLELRLPQKQEFYIRIQTIQNKKICLELLYKKIKITQAQDHLFGLKIGSITHCSMACMKLYVQYSTWPFSINVPYCKYIYIVSVHIPLCWRSIFALHYLMYAWCCKTKNVVQD